MRRLLVSGGTVVTSSGRRAADILIQGERVAALLEPATRVAADERLDVRGLLVFPGFIDPHVHSRDPGATEKEDFAHSTRAAAAGGITTLLEMPNAIPAVADVPTLHERRQAHERHAFVDFGLWALSLGAENVDVIPDLLAAGAIGIKAFWGYSLDRRTRALVYNPDGVPPEDVIPPPDIGNILDVCREVVSVGGLLAAHCEESTILRSAQAASDSDVDSYDDLLRVRPTVAESASIAVATELARSTRCRFHVVHMSSRRGVELVRQAQRQGISLSAETCPHYLTLTSESFATLGPIMKVFPPIREKADQEALWEGVNDGTIGSIGSDHAPHTLAEKSSGLATAPAGSTGVETIASVIVDAAIAGRTTLERAAWVLSESTARLYGLFPRKGSLKVSADADLTIIDPERDWTVDGARLHTKQRWSPWDGVTLRGKPVLAMLRGDVLMREGEPVGERRGRFVRSSNGKLDAE